MALEARSTTSKLFARTKIEFGERVGGRLEKGVMIGGETVVTVLQPGDPIPANMPEKDLAPLIASGAVGPAVKDVKAKDAED